MNGFGGRRVEHEYVQHNAAAPERVFPLLCPVREAEWVPGWEYRLVYSKSGVAEPGCVFTTQNEAGPETTWICTEHDLAAQRVSFAWMRPQMVACEIRIQLASRGDGETDARIRYRYTGLSEAGNQEIEGYQRAWFEAKMQGWEKAINHYLRTGKKLGADAGWE